VPENDFGSLNVSLILILKSGFESIDVSLVSSRLKNSFEMSYACLESIQVYSVNTCLKISFEMSYACLELIQVYYLDVCLNISLEW